MCWVYWGNPYATANSDNDSDHSGEVPIAVNMRAAPIDVSPFVAHKKDAVSA